MAIDWKTVKQFEREILSPDIVSACLTIQKNNKKIIRDDMHFPSLFWGGFTAFAYAQNTRYSIKQNYSLEFEMSDGKILPIIDFTYNDGKHNAKLADLSVFDARGISLNSLLDILFVIRDGYCVYKYIDNADGIVKYIGITRNMYNRYKQHLTDKLQDHDWTIAFIDGLSKTDAEILESHFISEYGTEKYFNVAKTTDGIAQFLQVPDTAWRYYYPSNKWHIIQ